MDHNLRLWRIFLMVGICLLTPLLASCAQPGLQTAEPGLSHVTAVPTLEITPTQPVEPLITPEGQEPTPDVFIPLPSEELACSTARDALVRALGVDLANVRCVETAKHTWSDACLELPQPGEVCAQLETPGFQVTLEVNSLVYEARADEAVTAVRIAGMEGRLAKYPGAQCQATFEHRELAEPYQRNKANDPRYTLDAGELSGVLALMDIQYFCVPVEFGAPFINVDWDAAARTAQQGRMLSLGFEGLYRGGGWSSTFVVYSTFDFQVGAMYDTFAHPEDFSALQEGSLPGMITVDGVKGYRRIQPSAAGFGTTTLYETFVFPVKDGYVAFVFTLGHFEGDLAPVIAHFEAGEYSPDQQSSHDLFIEMVESIRFIHAGQSRKPIHLDRG